jgi:hypothetical protein
MQNDGKLLLNYVGFLNGLSTSLKSQIEAIQLQLEDSSCKVFEALQTLSTSTEAKKKQAEASLDEAYFAPSSAQTAMIDSIQQSTDDIFEQASQLLQSSSTDFVDSSVVDSQNGMRRLGGIFSKHMESLSTMDDSIKDLIMVMVGVTSSSDVVKQRFDHVAHTVGELNQVLSEVLSNLNLTLSPLEIQKYRERLLHSVYQGYTMETERNIFKEIFGATPSLINEFKRNSLAS